MFDSSDAGAGGAILIVVLIGFYFLPLIIAGARHVPNVGSVAVINIFLGWTFIGWIVALAMACRSAPPVHQINMFNQPRTLQSAAPPPPAGWYPDPLGRAKLRYYDGAVWTDHVN